MRIGGGLRALAAAALLALPGAVALPQSATSTPTPTPPASVPATTPAPAATTPASSGNPETTPGGKALKFYASVRVDIRRIGAIKQTDGVVTGNRTRVKVVKNKVAPPFTEAEFDIMYNEGISSTGALLDLALEKQIIEKRGSWLSYKGTQLAQGRDAGKEALRNDPELYGDIEAAVKAKLDEDKK